VAKKALPASTFRSSKTQSVEALATVMSNSFLFLLEILMITRDGTLWIRHRRPFRLAFVVFWALLAYAHHTDRKDLYPLIAIALVTALVMKRREHSSLARMLEIDEVKQKTTSSESGLYDRKIDHNLE
jgi:hypothetical protein